MIPTTTFIMNLFLKKTGLLLTLGVLFFTSCKNADEIQLDPDKDPNQKGTYFLDNFPISISTILLDKFSSRSEMSGDNYMLFGSYSDPHFGTVTASSFSEVGARDHRITSDSSEVLSFKIHLDINYTTGDFSNPQKILVHRLSEAIYEEKMSKREYNFSSPATPEGELLVNGEIRPDSFSVNKGRFAFDLPEALATEFFEKLKKANEITSQGTFLSFFKGISLRGDLRNTAVFGANRDSSFITLTYKYNQTHRKDTVNVTFPISPYHYNKVDINRTAALNITNTGIVQSGTGILSKISFPSILDLKSSGKNIAINSAILEITPNEEANIAPPKSLFLIVAGYRSDTQSVSSDSLLIGNGGNVILNSGHLDSIAVKSFKLVQKDQFYQLQSQNSNGLSLKYDATQNRYTGDITSYVEALLKDDKNKFSTELILYPEYEGAMLNRFFSYSLTQLSSQMVLTKDLSLNKAVIQNDKIKLKIYYTLLD